MSEGNSTRIRDLMDARGLKPTRFAQETGIKTSTMFSIVRGKTQIENIRVETFARLADGFGMTMDELYRGEQRSDLSEDESYLIKLYRDSNPLGRYEILRAVETFHHQTKDSPFADGNFVIHHSDPWPDE